MAANRFLSALACVLLALVTAWGIVACTGTAGEAHPANREARGQAVFARYCNSCHPAGQRGAGPPLPMFVASSTDQDLRTLIRQGKNRMPAFGPSVIPDDQLSDLIAYLRTLK